MFKTRLLSGIVLVAVALLPAPNESRPPVFSSMNCMTAYPCLGE